MHKNSKHKQVIMNYEELKNKTNKEANRGRDGYIILQIVSRNRIITIFNVK